VIEIHLLLLIYVTLFVIYSRIDRVDAQTTCLLLRTGEGNNPNKPQVIAAPADWFDQ
jgi:hypothetical protein